MRVLTGGGRVIVRYRGYVRVLCCVLSFVAAIAIADNIRLRHTERTICPAVSIDWEIDIVSRDDKDFTKRLYAYRLKGGEIHTNMDLDYGFKQALSSMAELNRKDRERLDRCESKLTQATTARF